MIGPSTLTLAVPAPTSGDYRFHLYDSDTPICTNQSIGGEASAEVRDLSRKYLDLFESGRPLVPAGTLDALGRELFDVWLADVWDAVETCIPPTGNWRFVVASPDADVLNLPWELLRLPGIREPLGLVSRASIRRTPRIMVLPEDTHDPRPGPLRVVYSACAPVDAGRLSYEKEEFRVLQVFTGAGTNVAPFGCNLGSFDELQAEVRTVRPHVVHLTGHGVVTEGAGHFAFEDERGHTDLKLGSTVAADALAGRGVQCAFVSGCQTGQAPDVEALNGLCQGLVDAGVPLAVGWTASILDDVAICFAESFYKDLAAGSSIDRAVVQARRDARRLGQDRSPAGAEDASWTLPVLYAATAQAALFDPSAAPVPPPRKPVKVQALPGMTEGFAAHFVGRRREIQRVLPRLQGPSDLNTVLVTGVGGAGKSTLATRLARALETKGFAPIAVPSSDENPLSTARLIDACRTPFLRAGLKDTYALLTSADIEPRDKLRLLVDTLNEHPFTLVLDNVESILDRGTHEILNPTLAWFLPYLVNNLTGASRCLITSRYRPAEVSGDLPPVAHELPLPDFPEGAFLKFLTADPDVERRVLGGDLPRDVLADIYALLGGTPRFLEQIRTHLRTADADALRADLDAIDLPDADDEDENALRKKRDDYLADLFVADLYASLPARSQDALARAAVYTVPMTPEGFVAAATTDADTVTEADVRGWLDDWQTRTFVSPLPTDGPDAPERYALPALLRGWLLARLDDDERTAAHRRAGEWLMELDEVEREEEVGLHPGEIAMEARARFLDAAAYDRARTVTAMLSKIFITRALYDEVMALNEEMLAQETSPIPLFWLGRVHSERSDYDEAEIWFEEVLNMSREIGNRAGEVGAMQALGKIAISRGAYDEAERRYAAAEKAAGEDDKARAVSLHGLATISVHRGDYDEAEDRFEESLSIKRGIGDRAGETATLHNLATIALNLGDYAQAEGRFAEVLKMDREIGNRAGEATTLHQMATIALRRGDYALAENRFGEALTMRREISHRAGEAATLLNLGILAAEVSRLREGLRLVIVSYVLSQQIGHAQTQQIGPHVGSMTSDLGYDRAQFNAEVETALASYAEDRGDALLREAFPEGWTDNLSDAETPEDPPD